MSSYHNHGYLLTNGLGLYVNSYVGFPLLPVCDNGASHEPLTQFIALNNWCWLKTLPLTAAVLRAECVLCLQSQHGAKASMHRCWITVCKYNAVRNYLQKQLQYLIYRKILRKPPTVFKSTNEF